ncbi:MAG: hydroxyphenylacetyl-CoA thioesterase PaaI [Hyphomonadaceae bacterium]
MNEADKLARQIADTLLQREGTGTAWGISIDDVREGYARIRMIVREDMLNGHRIGHGGMIFALADTAFAYACNSRNEITLAQHASISFLAPAQPRDVLIAEAREVSRAGRSGVYQVSVRTAAGAVIAEFSGLSRTIGGAVIN